ncbi:hypothetical protein RB653_007031 [Dictyostelium firmibasis]|uniref:Uncharacterized protein n=1 Tax=Dictyostelium firmibasis TaxID=79012 RepID=A0AAN7YNN4_9MYCE
MNKIIIAIFLVISLVCVFGELNGVNGVQPKVCKMRADDCNKMHQAYVYSSNNGQWKDMPKDAQELFLSVFKNNC